MDGMCFESHSKIQRKKCGERLDSEVDRISKLPDEIVVVILSFLSLREAVTTSVLSSRWLGLWTHTPNLNFNYEVLKNNAIDELPTDVESGDPEMCKYIEQVNSVLQSHKAPILKEFKIYLYVNKSAQSIVTKWLEFVFSRKVERLEFNFDCWEAKNLIVLQELLKESTICWDQNLIIFRSLKSLFLGCFQVSGEDIKFLLRKLPMLEQLTINRSTLTSDVEVCGADLMLKHLKILHCRGEKSIKVSAPNLTWLGIEFGSSKLLVENVPKLVGARFIYSSNSQDTEQHFASGASCCISQLESLGLTLCHPMAFLANGFPKMPNLKNLVFTYLRFYDPGQLPITALLWTSRHLQEFELELIDRGLTPPSRIEVVTKVEESPHQHLKVFEFRGFSGAVADHVELLTYISKNCFALQKIIIDCESLFTEVPKVAVQIAKDQLKGKISPHIELLFP